MRGLLRQVRCRGRQGGELAGRGVEEQGKERN